MPLPIVACTCVSFKNTAGHCLIPHLKEQVSQKETIHDSVSQDRSQIWTWLDMKPLFNIGSHLKAFLPNNGTENSNLRIVRIWKTSETRKSDFPKHQPTKASPKLLVGKTPYIFIALDHGVLRRRHCLVVNAPVRFFKNTNGIMGRLWQEWRCFTTHPPCHILLSCNSLN